MNEIEKLREEVREVDRKIIKLIGKRLSITKKIGGQKKRKGIPLKDWKVEKEVIKNALNTASEKNLSHELIKTIMQNIITESKIQQEILHYSSYSGDREDILIIGGLGEMGQWFANFFANQGHNVFIYDIQGKAKQFKSFDNLSEAVKKASCILLAIPFEIIPDFIEKIIKLKFKGMVLDIASLKDNSKKAIKKALSSGISYVSIHPMFGPKVSTLSDRIICICDCGDKKANEKAKTFFKDTSATIVELPLKEHDRIISYVLALSHIINIIFMKTLMDGEYDYEDLKRVASTTFNSQMKTTKEVISENSDLYFAIQKFNPFKNTLYERLEQAMKYVIEAISEGNKKDFIEIMKQGEKWLKKAEQD
jgi:chorismate mutase/prephenate dehydrogenase